MIVIISFVIFVVTLSIQVAFHKRDKPLWPISVVQAFGLIGAVCIAVMVSSSPYIGYAIPLFLACIGALVFANFLTWMLLRFAIDRK